MFYRQNQMSQQIKTPDHLKVFEEENFLYQHFYFSTYKYKVLLNWIMEIGKAHVYMSVDGLKIISYCSYYRKQNSKYSEPQFPHPQFCPQHQSLKGFPTSVLIFSFQIVWISTSINLVSLLIMIFEPEVSISL